MAKRLLVLTSATGAGHDTHALATAAWCRRIYGDAVEVTIAHALEESHGFYRGGVAFYNFIQRRMPWFHHIYYNAVELIELLNFGTVGFGRAYYADLLERVRPEAILSVHDCLNRGYFEMAKEVLGAGVTCATYCVEFGGGYGFSRNWVNARGADCFFARTQETAREGRRRGMTVDRALAAGHWAPPSFHETPLGEDEKWIYLRSLQLDPNRFTLLLSTGGAGAQNHLAVLRALAPLRERLQVIALCGRQDEARQVVQGWADKNAPFPVCALGFTDEMPKLLQASTAVFARAGATTAGEALLCGCPVIFNGIGGVMPQELPTLRYFRARRINSTAWRPLHVRNIVERWLDRPEEFQQLRTRMAGARDATTPQEALGKLLSS